MKVKAIQPAFFNGSRVRVGQELDVPSGMKGAWFVRMSGSGATCFALFESEEAVQPAYGDERSGGGGRREGRVIVLP